MDTKPGLLLSYERKTVNSTQKLTFQVRFSLKHCGFVRKSNENGSAPIKV